MQQVRHGTNQGWLQGCRKPCCRNARNCWTRNQRKLNGYSVKVPVTSAVNYIRELQDRHGATIRQVAQVSGVSRTTLDYWVCDRTETARKDSVLRVLRVKPEDLDGYQVPADGSRRRLQAMALRGFGLFWISERTGIKVPTLSDIRRGEREGHVTFDTYEKIRSACNSSLLLPELTSGNATQVKNNARENGFLHFGVWEDIDDPECVPELNDPEYADPSLQDAIERCRSLTVRGFTLGEVADAGGVPRPNLHKIVHGKKKYVTTETVKKIHAGCDKLDVLPDSKGPFADRARRIAKRNGWM